jgi:AraC-like DNA-binding protein/mannose-6-phosphate isomerase-like protein (cupin superfamily)
MKSASFREVFTHDDGRSLLPELPMVAWARHNQARVPGLEPHAHPQDFELFLIERGSVEWWVEKELHRLPANHLYLNRPGERHGSVGRSFRPCGYLWIQLRLPVAISHAPALGALQQEIESFTRRSFVSSAPTREAFHALWELHRTPPPHAEMALRAQLHLLLVRVAQDYRASLAEGATAASARKSGHTYAIRRAIRMMEARLTDIASIADLAVESGLGVTQFSERFLEETGFTPANYLRRQRIERAKALLVQGGQTLAAIAQDTGFSSGQHLATVFKQIEGQTPTAYARQSLSPAIPRIA